MSIFRRKITNAKTARTARTVDTVGIAKHAKPTNTVKAKVSSNKGFYIGDVCYVLSDENYHNAWGLKNHYRNGKVKTSGGYSFAVARTDIGDGLYEDEDRYVYPVDASNIGLVPLELCCGSSADLSLGRVVKVGGTAEFKVTNGVFDITLPGGKDIHIDTSYWSAETWAPHSSQKREGNAVKDVGRVGRVGSAGTRSVGRRL